MNCIPLSAIAKSSIDFESGSIHGEYTVIPTRPEIVQFN